MRDVEATLGNVKAVEFDMSCLRPLLGQSHRDTVIASVDKDAIQWIAKVTGTDIEEKRHDHKVRFASPASMILSWS